MNIDRERLRADLGVLARECRALKNVLGTTWTRPMAEEQRHLVRVRLKVTELCVLRAWSRGKLHVRRPGEGAAEAWAARIAERVGKDYARPDTDTNADANAEGGAR